MLTTFSIKLCEYCPPGYVRGVACENEATFPRRHCQDWCCDEGALQGSEGLLVFPVPHIAVPNFAHSELPAPRFRSGVFRGVVLHQLMQGCSDVRVVADELAIVRGERKEPEKLPLRLGPLVVQHGFHLLLLHLHARLGHRVPQELQLVLREHALRWVGNEAKSSQSSHDAFALLQVVLQGVVAVDADVIEEGDTASVLESAQGLVDGALKLLRCGRQSHREDCEAEKPVRARVEGCLVPRVLGQW